MCGQVDHDQDTLVKPAVSSIDGHNLNVSIPTGSLVGTWNVLYFTSDPLVFTNHSLVVLVVNAGSDSQPVRPDYPRASGIWRRAEAGRAMSNRVSKGRTIFY